MVHNLDDDAAFCLVCGAPLVERPLFGASRKTCSRCAWVFWRPPAAAAAAVVVRGREVLLVRRGIQPYFDHWGLPSGFQDYGESPEATAQRETREETGLEVAIVRLLDVCYATDDPRKRVNVVVYLARPVAGMLRAADDATDARWFSLDALPEPLAFASNRRVLAGLRARFPHGDIV
jgi:8-oxo-dGTP diphosphatase